MSWRMPPVLTPVALLLVSNVFMTFAWYGHLKFTDRPLWLVVVASRGIALVEYCFAVPANRWGSAAYNGRAQDHAEGDHALGVRRLLGALSRRAHHPEPPRRL